MCEAHAKHREENTNYTWVWKQESLASNPAYLFQLCGPFLGLSFP